MALARTQFVAGEKQIVDTVAGEKPVPASRRQRFRILQYLLGSPGFEDRRRVLVLGQPLRALLGHPRYVCAV